MGFGLFQTSEFDPQLGESAANKPSGNTIFGFRWFITDMFNVRTEYRQYFFEKFGGGVSIPAEESETEEKDVHIILYLSRPKYINHGRSGR